MSSLLSITIFTKLGLLSLFSCLSLKVINCFLRRKLFLYKDDSKVFTATHTLTLILNLKFNLTLLLLLLLFFRICSLSIVLYNLLLLSFQITCRIQINFQLFITSEFSLFFISYRLAWELHHRLPQTLTNGGCSRTCVFISEAE